MIIGRLNVSLRWFPIMYQDGRLWFSIIPGGKDMDTGEWYWLKPKFKFQSWMGKPCVTRWIYDWCINFGYLVIEMKAKVVIEMKAKDLGTMTHEEIRKPPVPDRDARVVNDKQKAVKGKDNE